MIKILTGTNQKKIALFLLFIFYADFLAAYASYKSSSPVKKIFTSKYLVNRNFTNSRTELNTNNKNTSEVQRVADEVKLETVQSDDKKSVVNNKVDIGGPGQPEMNTFKSVGADNMVNLFTGDFSYNIPLLDVGGYPVNIFYTAGTTMDQEASWTGLGWNINPGTISRSMRGLPDDYNGQDVITKTQSMKPDITVGVNGSTGKEIIGIPGLSINANAGIFYNNRRGIGLEAGSGFDYSIMKSIAEQTKTEKMVDTIPLLTFSGGINLNSQNGMTVNGGASVYAYSKDKLNRYGLSTTLDYNSRQGLTDLRIGAEFSDYKWKCNNIELRLAQEHAGSAPISNISFARSSFTPSIRMPLTTVNQFYSVKIGKENKVIFKHGAISGYLNESRIDKKDQVQIKPAYGFMYYEKANDDKDALLDFNRLQDGVYTYKTPVISIPAYTYDVFSISGEGTGGSFRGYRGNMGYVRDNFTKTRTSSITVSTDLGIKDIFHGGTILGGVYSPTEVDEWKNGNTLRQTAGFKKNDGKYQTFYFRNPGEQAIIDEEYYNKLGGDQLIRPFLINTKTASPLLSSQYQVFDADGKVERTVPVDENSYRKERDKRTQVISYLTAEEADLVGLDKYIYSFTENEFQPGSCGNTAVRTSIKRYNKNDPNFYRKGNHLSEIDVLESDGRRYVYGIPVYQVKQKEVTFSTESVPSNSDQLISYTPGIDNSVKNNKGRDGLFQSEDINGYAHSFLLTGILSPDYIDVSGDGITDDDKGTAVKFNYSRVNRQKPSSQNNNYWNPFKWRMPVQSSTANYNEGLKADSRDDKGLYTYGEKELWYMHSIESKNMVATFYVSDRRDGNPVTDENGGLDGTSGKTMQKKLDKINLYTKADYLKYGANARPVKTVHFEYDYSACPDYVLNDQVPIYKNSVNINANKGKLTLVSIWFSYNGNNSQVKNKYLFKYAATNPSYNSAENDKWGNYKPHSENPDQVGNNDYPYTLQDLAKSNLYSSAWNLEKILLPGGAVMNVQYEADDYSFVQDKRASQMTKVTGFGSNSASTPSDKLYTWNFADAITPGKMDHRFVFFDAAQSISDRNEISQKYLQGFKQLLLKLWVKMPKGNIGQSAAFEPVVIYGVIKDYGFAKNADGSDNHNRFYVELAKTRNGGSPIMETVLQFLKDHLPSRAYPGYEVKDGSGLIQLVRSLYGMIFSYFQGVIGFEKSLKVMGKCRETKLSMSFGRLNNPSLKKLGGGHRVKQIMIVDNWNRMTSQYDSYYGQQYDYSTTEMISGQAVNISSGVASYEPGVGNEENPFREVLSYSETQFLGPTDHNNIELPLAETFFPSPMIGYGKVVVRSIHNKDNKNIKSGIGGQQTEFYTTRDFPVISDFTSFDIESRHQHKPGIIQKVFNFDKKDFLTLTQGVRVVLNDMNGKLKSQTSFAENDLKTPVNYTGYFYRLTKVGENKYKLDNKVPVISGPDGKISNKLIGRDVEVMNDFREHLSYTYAANIPLNVDFFKAGTFPILIPTIFRMAFRDKSMYRSATTLKIVNEYGIIDSVVTIDKGSIAGTKNLVYDAETGGVLISRTNNEFDKPVYQFNYPAWWVNSGMEPAYKNIDVLYEKVLFRNGRIEESPQVNLNFFESGDELYAVDNSLTGPTQSLACIIGGDPTFLPQSNEYRIWALDIRKDTRNTEKEFVFIDRFGNPYNAANATIRIIRSGKRNITSASAGSIVSMNSPYRTINGQEQVIIDNATDVINAGAAEFKERWRVNDMFYAKDSVVRVVRQTPINILNLSPEIVYTGEYVRRDSRQNDVTYQSMINKSFEIFKKRRKVSGLIGSSGYYYDQNSWAKFSLPSTLSGVTITSATLNLIAHNDNHASPSYAIGLHNYMQPHYNGREEGTGYYSRHVDFKVSRMITPWYGSSDNYNWKRIFDDNIYNTANPITVSQIPFQVPPPGSFNRSIFPNVTGIAQQMVNNMSNQSITSGIKISFVQHSGNIAQYAKNDEARWRYCFRPEVTLNLNYYRCSSTDLIVYQGDAVNAPTVPPAGYFYCNTDETFTFCLSVFDKKKMNPYIEGVLGNWRGWRSYVYYGERRENDPALPTDIRKDGIIKDFEPYWAFDNTNTQLGKTNSTKWVWNSEITQYNRKGAELEDHDPLGRYNAGIYGYQESLPIAVVNNSRLRFSAFDGFEDYFYKDDPCEPYCKPSKRHFPTGVTTAMLDESQSHTGKYSLKVNAGSTYSIDVKISPDNTDVNPDIRIKLDKTAYQQAVSVNPKGIGLKGFYYNDQNFGGTAYFKNPVDEYVNLAFRSDHNGNCQNHDDDDPPSGVRCKYMSARWKGKIQVVTSGNYEFLSSNIDDEGYVYVNGVLVATDILGGTASRTPVYLTAGTLHDIEIKYKQTSGDKTRGSILLLWKKQTDNNFTSIPMKHLYPEGKESLANGSVVTQTVYCEKPDDIQAINNHLIDSFNLVSGKSMLISTWIKKGVVDCKCNSYSGIDIKLKDASGNVVATLQPKEKIIEGWQQYEAVFTVPAGVKLKLEFNGPADAILFADDVRLHPFNANMKSFIYDPVTLRLAAELDENNYASFYEYDDDGTLIRVKKETRQGIKTITETRSATQKAITNF